MTPLRTANLAIKFLLELAAFTAFAYWGTVTGSGALSILLGIAAPATAIILWSVLAAPRSSHRLPTATRVPFELAVFALAAGALVAAGNFLAAITLTVIAIANSALLTVFDQWSQ